MLDYRPLMEDEIVILARSASSRHRGGFLLAGADLAGREMSGNAHLTPSEFPRAAENVFNGESFMARGGKRPGAGRPRGVQSKGTLLRKMNVERGLQAILEDGILPLDVMMRRMRGDTTITDAQFAAAQAAAPYVHPKLTAVEMNAVIKRNAADMSDEDLAAIAGASRAGSSGEPAKGPDQLH